ncbi:MAG: von Willebrand factor type A domain-containing protein [bacterium]
MNRPLVVSILALGLIACEQTPDRATSPQTDVEDRFVSIKVPAAPQRDAPTLVEESAENEEPAEQEVADIQATVQEAGILAVQNDTKHSANKGAADNAPLVRTSKVTVNGSAGLGLRGAGQGGGGGQGFGRIGGLGKVDTGGGKGTGAKIGRRSGMVVGYGRGAGGYGRGAAVGQTPRYESTGVEKYAHYKTNAFTDPTVDRFSTFAIDVDTGSYTIARRKLNDGALPPSDSVRVEEFVNYFKYGYAAPSSSPVAVHLEAAPSPFSGDPNTKVLRVGVQAQRVEKAGRKPIHLTFLVDVSGSMSSPDKLGLAKRSLAYLVDNLREEDTVAIATYAGRVAEILRPTSAGSREKILAALETLQSGGSTAMDDGLALAYTLAEKQVSPGHVSRVIVLSDGDANVGRTGHDEILKRIESHVAKGVTLSTIGFGMGNYKDEMMEQLANKGNGNYYYIDDMKEAKRIFGEQLDGTLQVVAKDVKIQVEFDETLVSAYRLIGYENRDIADKDFRNDKVDAGEMGAGHTVTALYEVKLKSSEPASFATVRVRHKLPEADNASESKFPLSVNAIRPTVEQCQW